MKNPKAKLAKAQLKQSAAKEKAVAALKGRASGAKAPWMKKGGK